VIGSKICPLLSWRTYAKLQCLSWMHAFFQCES